MLSAFGKKYDERKAKSMQLIRAVTSGSHELFTPFTLIDIVVDWKIKYFKEKILRFYEGYSKELITAKKLDEKLFSLDKDVKNLLNKFRAISIKEEDAVLVIIASVFNLELKTFNQKHLLKKKTEINEILKEENLTEIYISEP